MAKLVGFVGPSYTSQSKIAADDELVNWYVEQIESGTGTAQYVLYPCPGVSLVATAATSPGRGMIYDSTTGKFYVLSGSVLYDIVGTSANSIATGFTNINNAIVSLASNGFAGHQILIACDNVLYCYNTVTTVLTTVPTTDAVGSFVVYVNGYFVALDPLLGKIYFSALNDGTSWSALDVAQRNDADDQWISMVASHKQLYLFGSQTGSIYNNVDDPTNPFQPDPSAFLQVGIVAARSAAVVNGEPLWLGQNVDGAVSLYYLNGYTPMRVSTHAFEFELASYGVLTDAEAMSYQYQGHAFYEITFPTAGVTWVYDATTRLLFKEGEWNGLTFSANTFRGRVAFNDLLYCADRTNGKVWLRSNLLFTGTDGNGMRRLRRAPHVTAEGKRLVIDQFQLWMEVGVGLSAGQGSDPLVMLRVSKDGGQIWGNERTMSAGAIGEYKTRVIWPKLGGGRDWVFEVSVSDPVPWRLIEAYIEPRVGTS